MFSPLGATVVAVLVLPFVLGGLYWLFVVNGPTPVVKARIDTVTTEPNQNNVVFDPGFWGSAKFTLLSPKVHFVFKLFGLLGTEYPFGGLFHFSHPQIEVSFH